MLDHIFPMVLTMKKFITYLVLVIAGFAQLPLMAKGKEMQQTLSIIKPDAVAAQKIGAVVASIEASGLRVAAMRMTQLSEDQAALFYAVHKERPFYKSLIAFMSSGPVVAMVLEGDNAVEAYRTLMGPTDPAKAPRGTLRKEFGTNVERNAVHGSDSVENAKKEIAFFFSEGQIYSKK